MGVSFHQKDLLHLALAHSSYLNEKPGTFSQSNERLEYLGDALIGAFVAQELYRQYPQWSEGELTQARSILVRGETLAGVANRLQLGKRLYMGNGEEASGGRGRTSNLAAALEALVGALFLDRGYEAARDFFLRLVDEEISTLRRRSVPNNPKSTLQEAVQAKGLAPPSYRVVEAAGSDHSRRFTVEVSIADRAVGCGTGARKSQAEQEAAANALRSMDMDEDSVVGHK